MPLPNYKASMVVEAADLLAAFRSKVPELREDSLTEILHQIFHIFLNNADSRLDLISALPNAHGIGDTIFQTNPAFRRRLQEAASSLGLALYRRLDSLGAFNNGGLHKNFPYYYDRRMQDDLVLIHIPY